jgi:hypothetical protein
MTATQHSVVPIRLYTRVNYILNGGSSIHSPIGLKIPKENYTKDAELPSLSFPSLPFASPNDDRCHVLVPERIGARQSLTVSIPFCKGGHSDSSSFMSRKTMVCRQRSVLQATGFIELGHNMHNYFARKCQEVRIKLLNCESSPKDVKVVLDSWPSVYSSKWFVDGNFTALLRLAP